MDVKLEFKGRPFATVELEVAVEEAGGLTNVDTIVSTDGPAILAAVGLPQTAAVPVLTHPVQMAQKLHACTAPDTDTWVNDRAHDLIDLQLIRHDLDDQVLPNVQVECRRLFRARNAHRWPPEVTVREGWPERYEEERQDVEADVIVDLDGAVVWANQLIAEIDSA